MGDTPHADSTHVHLSLDTLRTKFRNLRDSMTPSPEQSFTIHQIAYTIIVLLYISAAVFFVLPLWNQQGDILGFWTTQTAAKKCDDTDIPSLLSSLAALLAAVFAITVFSDAHPTKQTQHDSRSEYNDYHKTRAIQDVVIFLAIGSQALLTMEMPRLIDSLHRIPGWTLALVFFLVNVISVLSVFDFSAWVDNAFDAAKERKRRYQAWKDKQSGDVPMPAHSRARVLWLHYAMGFVYSVLTFLPIVSTTLKQNPVLAIGVLAIVSAFSALLVLLFTIPLFSWSLEADVNGSSFAGDAFMVALILVVIQLLLNISVGFSGLGTLTCRVVTQVIASMVAIFNVLLFRFAWPRCLMLPYLMMVCDKKIRKQDRVLDRAASIFKDPGKRQATDMGNASTQAPAVGHRENTMKDTGNRYDAITGEGMPRSRSDAWRIGFGLQAAAGLEPSDYAVAQAQDQIAGDVSYAEVEQNLRDYHAAHRDGERHFEADIVATRISSLLQDPSFVFSPVMLDYIHESLFQGVLPGRQAGVRRSSDFSERESLPGGGRVAFVPHRLVDGTLRRAFDQERRRRESYAGMPRRDIADSVTGFISGLWQVRPFSKGNTRAVMVLAIMYLRLLGFTVNPEPFSSLGAYLHDALVLDNVLDPDVRDPAPLRRFMDAVLFDPGIDLPPVGTRDDGTGHAL